MTPVRLEPTAPRSRVKHSTTIDQNRIYTLVKAAAVICTRPSSDAYILRSCRNVLCSRRNPSPGVSNSPVNRGSYRRAHVLLDLLNEGKEIKCQAYRKEIKCEACRSFNLFFAASLINSIMYRRKNVKF